MELLARPSSPPAAPAADLDACPPHLKPSTWRNYLKGHELFKEFCEQNQRNVDDEILLWTCIPDGFQNRTRKEPCEDVIVTFFSWIKSRVSSDSSFLSTTTFQLVVNWSQTTLTTILEHKHEGYIKSLNVVQDIIRNLKSIAAEKRRENPEDMHVVHATVTIKDLIQMSARLLCTEIGIPRSDPQSCLSNLMMFQARLDILFTHLSGARGEVSRQVTLAGLAVLDAHNIGGQYTRIASLGFATTRGKTNQSGQPHWYHVLPHFNPLLCPVAATGMLLLFRRRCEGERAMKHLDFTDGASLVGKPLLRQADDAGKHMTTTVQSDCFHATFSAVNLKQNSVTHSGRHMAQQQQFFKNVPPDQICMSVGYKQGVVNPVQSRHYLNVPIIQAMLAVAGGDPKHPELYAPPHLQVPVPDALVELAWPGLVANAARAAEALRSAPTSAAAKKDLLFQASGVAAAVKYCVSTALAVAAASGLDEDNVVDEPVLQRFHDNRLFVNMKDVFATPEFQAFSRQVRQEQVAYSTRQRFAAGGAGVPELEPLLQRLLATMERLEARHGEVPAPGHTSGPATQPPATALAFPSTDMMQVPTAMMQQLLATMERLEAHQYHRQVPAPGHTSGPANHPPAPAPAFQSTDMAPVPTATVPLLAGASPSNLAAPDHPGPSLPKRRKPTKEFLLPGQQNVLLGEEPDVAAIVAAYFNDPDDGLGKSQEKLEAEYQEKMKRARLRGDKTTTVVGWRSRSQNSAWTKRLTIIKEVMRLEAGGLDRKDATAKVEKQLTDIESAEARERAVSNKRKRNNARAFESLYTALVKKYRSE